MERVIGAEPEAVWAVLAQPAAYAGWVVWMTDVRRADDDWPRPGTGFDYAFRWGPLGRTGRATCLEAHPPHHLRWRWRHRLLADSIAELTIHPEAGGSRIRLTEAPTGLFFGLAGNALIDAVAMGNEVTSLDRLHRLARRSATRAD
jgi:uncharacterized protein YndB with AHSA1/START domain